MLQQNGMAGMVRFIQNMKRLMPLPEAEQQKEDEYVFFFDFDKKEETYGNK